MEPFKIEVSDEILQDLQERLARARFPDQLNGADWDYGTELNYLKSLCDYWLNTFDWRKHEAELNSFDHFKTDIDGLNVHYIHARSAEPNALPIVITHGWPGSVFEFHKIIGPLTDPAAHGGDPADAFHVVCPSMPGYGFSDAPREPGFSIREVAATNAKRMATLGYSKYGAQGGDWGAIATAWTGHLDPEHVCGIHMNMLIARPPEGVENPMEGLSELEMGDVMSLGEFTQKETGYQQIQGTKPQTLGYGLNDSPVGLAGWIVEKFRSWSDCNGNVENRFSKDELLTNIMIYWVTQSITSSTRLYCETMRANLMTGGAPKVDVPTAGAIFPKEIYRAPRAWAEQSYNIQQWNRFDSGGHFAALEEPEVLVEDVRTFFRTLR